MLGLENLHVSTNVVKEHRFTTYKGSDMNQGRLSPPLPQRGPPEWWCIYVRSHRILRFVSV